MLCLASNIRPGIASTVHQCSRFYHCVKYSHDNAVLRICSISRENKKGVGGVILSPKKNINVDCYSYADFWSICHQGPSISNLYKVKDCICYYLLMLSYHLGIKYTGIDSSVNTSLRLCWVLPIGKILLASQGFTTRVNI